MSKFSIRYIISAILLLSLFSCKKEKVPETEDPVETTMDYTYVSAVDISSFPEINASNQQFFDSAGNEISFLSALKANGVNTIRLRLWVNPTDGHSSLNEVKTFAATLRTFGFRIWLTVHYSDTWADPGQQLTPASWQGISSADLKDSVYNYTTKLVEQLAPDFIQIGNEINSGILHPTGNSTTNPQIFKELLSTGIQAVRDHSSKAKIILHYAGIKDSDWFFSQLESLDYDIIGLSFYPIWHGKNLDSIATAINTLAIAHNKEVVLAETSYPFTLGYNDYTNNVVGLESQLILPDYPASAAGQLAFVERMKKMMLNDVTNGIGLCYWGGELVAWKGSVATDGSSWENQALFDFDNKILPVAKAFTFN